MNYNLKSYEELCFSDDFLFSKIMKDPKIAKGVVESLLGFKIKKVKFLESQHTIDEVYGSKGIRLDAYLEGSDKVIDIEMQTVIKTDEGLRMRYYQSLMDIELLNRGENYRNLKETYVLFICLTDPIGEGKAVYNFVTKEIDGECILNDRIHKVLYNAGAFEKSGDPKVKAFLRYIKEKSVTDQLTKQIQDAVTECKHQEKWRPEYMLWKDQVREWKDEAHEAGWTEGLAEEKRTTVANLLKSNIAADIIAKCTGLSINEVLAVKNS